MQMDGSVLFIRLNLIKWENCNDMSHKITELSLIINENEIILYGKVSD